MGKGLAIASELRHLLHCDNQTLAAALIYSAFTQLKESNEVLTSQIDDTVIKLVSVTWILLIRYRFELVNFLNKKFH